VQNYPFNQSPQVLDALEILGFEVRTSKYQDLLEVFYPISSMKRKYVALLLSLLEGEADKDIIDRMA